MAEHHELVAEMPILEQMGTQERQKLAKKRRLQQLKRWAQREKERLAKEKQMNKRLANKISEENNGLDLKQYTSYYSNSNPSRSKKKFHISSAKQANNTSAVSNAQTNGNYKSKSSSNHNTKANSNPKANHKTLRSSANDDNNNDNEDEDALSSLVLENGKSLTPNGRVHFQSGVMLMEAAARNDLDEVKRLLMLGVSPDSMNQDGLTALHQCCIDASENMMRLLLKYGANVDAKDTEQWTPLHAACTCGHLTLVEILIENGANLLAVNSDGSIPFDICEDEATCEYVESQMVKRGITQDMINEARTGTESRMLGDLQAKYGETKQTTTTTNSELNDNQNTSIGSNVVDQPVTESGASVMHIAAANGYVGVVKYLLSLGADPNVCDNDDWTPLHGVACWGTGQQHIEIIELLVDAGADMDAKTANDTTVFDLCDNVNVLERLNQLKDELESKQAAAAAADMSLRRTRSRTNSRIHSVRRTSVRDKNQLSRRDAREEAMFRVESSEGIQAQPTSSVAKTEQNQQQQQQQATNGYTQTDLDAAMDAHIKTHANGVSETEATSTVAESMTIGSQSDDNHTQNNAHNCEQPRSSTASSSSSSLAANQMHSSESMDREAQQQQRREPPTPLSSLASSATLSNSAAVLKSTKRDTQHSDAGAQQHYSIIAGSQQQQQCAPAVQLAPTNYTLSNLKKQRSDMRMRAVSIGAQAQQQQQQQQDTVDSFANGTTHQQQEQRSHSPNMTFRKFHGEPSEAIGAADRRSGRQCCVLI